MRAQAFLDYYGSPTPIPARDPPFLNYYGWTTPIPARDPKNLFQARQTGIVRDRSFIEQAEKYNPLQAD
jgi:hypothetical protein